ncbi:MAG TPA: hypothetical protein PKE40_04150 [Arachnia sp.]|nr:hypothetical protein [Arachnia sp.]HMT85524.1 hypothetical protein [Arachnia sp.]
MRTLIAVVALGGLLVSGCGRPATEDTSEPPIADPPPPLTSVTQIAPPLLGYSPTPQEAATIQMAQGILAAECVSRFGLSYSPDLTLTALSTSTDISPRYGPIDPAWVAEHGYAPQAPEFSEGDPNRPDPSPEVREVLRGVDENENPIQKTDGDGNPLHEAGCYGEAMETLFVEQPFFADLERLIEEGLGYSRERMAADSRVAEAEDAWLDCMSARGYSGDSYYDMGNAYATTADPAGYLGFAMDDVECAQQVNLPGIRYAVDSAYQERWLAEHGAEVKTLHDGYLAGLERAQKVMGGQ